MRSPLLSKQSSVLASCRHQLYTQPAWIVTFLIVVFGVLGVVLREHRARLTPEQEERFHRKLSELRQEGLGWTELCQELKRWCEREGIP
jgi:hypothetical protein